MPYWFDVLHMMVDTSWTPEVYTAPLSRDAETRRLQGLAANAYTQNIVAAAKDVETTMSGTATVLEYGSGVGVVAMAAKAAKKPILKTLGIQGLKQTAKGMLKIEGGKEAIKDGGGFGGGLVSTGLNYVGIDNKRLESIVEFLESDNNLSIVGTVTNARLQAMGEAPLASPEARFIPPSVPIFGGDEHYYNGGSIDSHPKRAVNVAAREAEEKAKEAAAKAAELAEAARLKEAQERKFSWDNLKKLFGAGSLFGAAALGALGLATGGTGVALALAGTGALFGETVMEMGKTVIEQQKHKAVASSAPATSTTPATHAVASFFTSFSPGSIPPKPSTALGRT